MMYCDDEAKCWYVDDEDRGEFSLLSRPKTFHDSHSASTTSEACGQQPRCTLSVPGGRVSSQLLRHRQPS